VDILAVELRSNDLDKDYFAAISFIVTLVTRLRTMNLRYVGNSNIPWSNFPTHFREALMDCLGLPSMKCVSVSRVDGFPIIALDQCTIISLDGKFDFSNSCSKSYPHLEALSIYEWPGMSPGVIAWAKKLNLRYLDIRMPSIDECGMLFQVCPTVTTLTLDLGHKRESSLHQCFHSKFTCFI